MYKWLAIILLLPVSVSSQVITTIAGTGTAGFSGDNGSAIAALLNRPTDVYKDLSGNIYIADNGNHRIRKINTAGIITTIAGNGIAAYTGDLGLATNASLTNPNSVAVDIAGNVYVADMGNNVVRVVNTSGIISTIAGTGISGFSGDGGPATSAELSQPSGVAVDVAGNIYLSDMGNSRIRKVDAGGIISTIAGGGTISFIQAGGYCVDNIPATSVKLCIQNDVSVDLLGNVYLTNYTCWHFSRISTDGMLHNVAGAYQPDFSANCGLATESNVYCPYGIYPDNLGNIYVCPLCNMQVRKVDRAKYITTVAGTGTAGFSGDGGPATAALVSSFIYGIYADDKRDVYFADVGNNVIRHFRSIPDDTFYHSICAGQTVLLSLDSGGKWTCLNPSIATIDRNGLVTGRAPGKAVITHLKSDACLGGEYYIVDVEQCQEIIEKCLESFGIPSAFSPNGDGENDILFVRGEGVNDILLEVYNRFGQRVFETRDARIGWDGTFNGQPMPIDVYGYFLKVSCKDRKATLKGNVTLLR